MRGRILHFGSGAHRVVDALLPWYANGTLDRDERDYVQRHLGQCARCRDEAEWLRGLYAACAAEARAGSSSVPARLLGQLASRPAERGLASRLRQALPRGKAWTWGAIAASLVAVGAATAVLEATTAPALYHTLGASGPPHSDGAVMVVFDPATTEAEMRRIVREADARLVDGPTRTNAYLLDVPAGRRRDAIDALRREPRVVLVEQLAPGDRGR